MSFQTSVRRQGRTVIIGLAGQVNALSQQALETAANEALEAAPRRILLDFAGVTFINSTGIAIIVGLIGRARAAQVKVEAFGLSDHYREIFEITRLVEFMAIHHDEAAAFGGGPDTGGEQ